MTAGSSPRPAISFPSPRPGRAAPGYRPRHARQAGGTRFRLLFVCTGNICRSPIAERLTRHILAQTVPAEQGRFEVASAGTWGHEGAPMEPYAAQMIAAYGADPGAFIGRELLEDHIAVADLVLTAAREHCSQVTSMGLGADPRTFTLKEFSRLVADLDTADLPTHDLVERARALVVLANRCRDGSGLVAEEADDVADPYGAPLSVYETCAAEIADALEPVLDGLTGADVGYADVRERS